MQNSDKTDIANFLFEVGAHAQTPRSFHSLLGQGKQSLAEHVHRVVYIGYVLSHLQEGVDTEKVLKMCLFHDLAEGRISDLNYVHQKYVERNENKAIAEITAPLPFGNDIKNSIEEYQEKESLESKIAKDADQIEFIMSLKEQADIGNVRAETWMPPAIKRIKTAIGRQLVEAILSTPSDQWWFGNKEDSWWVNRTQGN